MSMTLDDLLEERHKAHAILQPGLRIGRHLTLQERFEEWMATTDGQVVERAVLTRAFALLDRGFTHYGIAALWEAARYDRSVMVGPNAGFKLNNDFRSRLARRLMDEHPDLRGFFETRELKA
jgi:hypothetical protein